MTNKAAKIDYWIITKQPKGLSVPKEPHPPGLGRLFCSIDRKEMETEAKRLNGLEDGNMYFVDPQS